MVDYINDIFKLHTFDLLIFMYTQTINGFTSFPYCRLRLTIQFITLIWAFVWIISILFLHLALFFCVYLCFFLRYLLQRCDCKRKNRHIYLLVKLSLKWWEEMKGENYKSKVLLYDFNDTSSFTTLIYSTPSNIQFRCKHIRARRWICKLKFCV